MARLNRRDFLKAIGLSGVTAASACAWDDNLYRTPIEDVLPYVVKPEQITPGTPTFFATTITSGPSAYPVLGRHRDGRVINVESNRKTPLAAGVPKGALLDLQRHYSPDRTRGPSTGHGESAADLSWEDGLDRLAKSVQAARNAGKTVAYLGPYRSGAIVSLLRDYTLDNATFWEPHGHAAEAAAWDALFEGGPRLPSYDLSQATYVLSFGAPFLSWWGTPQMEADYAAARNPNVSESVVRFALVSPHMDQVGANADDWFPCRAGSQAHLAFGLAKLVAKKTGYAGPATDILANINFEEAIAAAGIHPQDADAIANHFKEAKGAVALPGATGDTDLTIATYLLNVVSGNTGRTFSSGGYNGPVHGFKDLKALIDSMNAGNVGVLLLDDANPVYSLPAAAGFKEALAKVETVVALSSHPDETNEHAHFTLPTSDAFEDWGDEEVDDTLLLLRQPVMSNLWDTRSLGDILLASARSAGLAAPAAPTVEPVTEETTDETTDETAAVAVVAPLGFSPKTWREYLQSHWQRNHLSGAADFQAAWEAALRDGHLTRDGNKHGKPTFSTSSYRFEPRTLADSSVDVMVYLHPHRFDGRYANQPWAQEVADPMTGHVWDSWAEVSTDLFDGGLSKNAEVEVKNEAGACTVGAVRYRGLAKKTLAIALGQGHTVANGRYAGGTGVNATDLVSLETDSAGNLLWNVPSPSMNATGQTADLVTTFGQDLKRMLNRTPGGDGGRNWGVSVDAKELAKHGDAPSKHPGEMTGIHHLPQDPRLVAAGKTNFYEAPDHPTYRFGMSVDTNACNGCGACVIACYAENNLPVVGKPLIKKGREMNWLRINRYWEELEPAGEHRSQYDIRFVPMMCQQCGHAPCESVCPVFATYHNIDGLNAMVYNRCVGTRYCANNCPYVVRRFNFHSYTWPEPFNLQLNPDVTTRTMGVMEKCTFCVQRIRDAKIAVKDDGFDQVVPNEVLKQLPACADACPSQALTFGNRKDEESTIEKLSKSARSYIIMEELNTFSAVNYLAKASYHVPHKGHGGHGSGETHPPSGKEPHKDAHDAGGH